MRGAPRHGEGPNEAGNDSQVATPDDDFIYLDNTHSEAVRIKLQMQTPVCKMSTVYLKISP